MVTDRPTVGAVVLAAGASSRMGSLKALLPWRGTTLAGYVVGELLRAPVAQIVVVTGNGATDVIAAVPRDPRVAFVANHQWEDGKAGSVIRGISVLPEGWHVLIAAIDQPRPTSLLCQVIAKHREGLPDGRVATIAGFGERRGHPIIFVPELRAELLKIDEATAGLRAVVTRHEASVRVADLGDRDALLNLNTPEEYTAAVASGSETPVPTRLDSDVAD
jgi:molybdenum cofactor cytidylyltransferase